MSDIIRQGLKNTLMDAFGDRNMGEGDWLPYEVWERLFKRSLVKNPTTGEVGFSGVLGPALAARYEWLLESKRLNLPPAEAERRFSETVEKERAQQRQFEIETSRIRARAAEQSKNGRRRGVEVEL